MGGELFPIASIGLPFDSICFPLFLPLFPGRGIIQMRNYFVISATDRSRPVGGRSARKSVGIGQQMDGAVYSWQ
jgi:hypothetical protein